MRCVVGLNSECTRFSRDNEPEPDVPVSACCPYVIYRCVAPPNNVPVGSYLQYSMLYVAASPCSRNVQHVIFFFFSHPMYYPRTTLALPPSSSSDPGSHSGPSSSLPNTVRGLIFIAIIIQRFLPLLTRVESCLPALLGAPSGDPFLLLRFCKYIQNLTTVGIKLKGQRY